MLNVLHITNGDSAANILKNSRLNGDTLPWRDTMHYGPFPGELNLDEVSKVRAAYFAKQLEEEPIDIERDFKLRNEHLKAANRYQEVVLWYEHDLLDQLQILQLLDWFGQNQDQINTLSLICIDHFDGIKPFRGLGQLNSEQMASLYESRIKITQAELTLAQKGWASFRSSHPTELESFIQTNELRPLPFLEDALQRHLLEYPHTNDGLTQTERQLLALIASGIQKPSQVFNENMALESVLFIGDWATYKTIAEMRNRDQALITCAPGDAFYHPPTVNIPREKFIQQRLHITPLGEKVLSGQENAINIIERDFWLGGVHINTHKSFWMWHSEDRKMVLKDT